jgi:hypothetical protein
MRIPVFLAVAQWALLLALCFLVIIMYRQLGRVFGRRTPSTDTGPAVGSKAVPVDYLRLSDEGPGYFAPGGHPALLAFVEPSCMTCDKLVAALTAADQAGELAGFRVLLLMSDPPRYLRVSESFRATHLEIGRVISRSTVDAYRAVATPLLVAIDTAAVVRAAGPAVESSDVRAYSQSCLVPPVGSQLSVLNSDESSAAKPDATVAAVQSDPEQR